LTFCTRIIVLAERTVAHDLATDAALEDPQWLRAFSHRLEIQGQTPGARPWVRYQ
jgi:hypothetical protein